MGVERSLAMQLSYLTLFLLTILIYFMWMDVALYINLQQVPPSRPNVKPIQTNITDYNYSPFYPLTVKLLYQVRSLVEKLLLVRN